VIEREAYPRGTGYTSMKPYLSITVLAVGMSVLGFGVGRVSFTAFTTHTNLAIDVVQTIEPDAKCAPMYNGEGAALTYSASCRLPNKATLMCSIDVGSTQSNGKNGPRGLECATLIPAPQAAQAAQATQAAPLPPPAPAPALPAPAAPPVVAPAPSDAGR
jgi:hypothetical protein